MSGIMFQVDHAFGSGIVIKNDQVLSAGSLMLIEPGLDSAAGVPAQLVNYADEYAAPLIGVSVPYAELNNRLVTGGFAERTQKGGLHVVVPTGVMEYTDTCRVEMPTALRQYLVDNVDHSYAVFASLRVTRNGSGTGSQYLAGLTANAGNAYVHQSRSTGNIGRISNSPIGATLVGEPPNQPFMCGVGSGPLAAITATGSLVIWGGNTTHESGNPSFILYRLYIEDLTVSGRSYTDVAAIEAGVFSQLFSPGGDYYEDTFSAP